MANKNPSPKTRFKKGQSGNMDGRTPVDPEIRKIKKLTTDDLKAMLSLLFNARDHELTEILKNENEPTLKKVIATALARARKTGDMKQIDLILNRAIGKVKEEVDLALMKPSILVRRNGDEVEFNSAPEEEDKT
jgi:hypothetical protein